MTVSSVPILITALMAGGLSSVRTTIDATTPVQGPRAYGLLLASRYPLADDIAMALASPWPEKVLSTMIECPNGCFETHGVHIPPGSSNGWVKVDVLEAVFMGLARPSERPRILCGDFNAPQSELRSGELVTWAQTLSTAGARIRGRFRGGPGTRWDAAERNVLCGLREFGIHDVYRAIHGYENEAASWILNRRGVSVARRFDHIFASEHFRPVACTYLEEWRRAGLSDHAAIEAELEPRSNPRLQPTAAGDLSRCG